MVDQLAMGAQTVGKEKDLGMERPGAHISIKVGQVGIFRNRLVKRLPTQAAAQ